MRAARKVRRDPGRRRAWLGGVNLLPYRAREGRRRQVRWLLLGTGAAACGCVAAGLIGLPDWLAARRVDAQRARVERSLAGAHAAAPVPAHAARAGQVRSMTAAREALLERFALMGALSFEGVRLRAWHADARGVSMRVEARDPAAAQAWLEQLRSRQPGQIFEIEDLRALAEGQGAPHAVAARGSTSAVILAVRVSRRATADVDVDHRESGRRREAA